MSDPRHTHDVEQVTAELRELAKVVAQHKQDLIEGGMDKAEAFALAQQVEERWATIIFERYERKHEIRAFEKVLDMIREELGRAVREDGA